MRKHKLYLSFLASIFALTINSGSCFAQEDDEDPIDDGDDVELIEESEQDIEGDEILNAGDLICLAGLYQSFETEEYSIEGSVVTYVEPEEEDSDEEEGYYEDVDSDELLGKIANKISSLKKKIKKAESPSKKRALKRKVAALVELRGDVNSCLEGEMYPEEWDGLTGEE